jgi:protein SCO1/2
MAGDALHLRLTRCLAACLTAAALAVAPAPAQILKEKDQVKELQGVDIVEKLEQKIDLSLTFTDSDASTVALRNYFDGRRPVVLAMVYFDCPIVCPLVLDRMAACFDELDYTIGTDFNVVVVSFNAAEGPTHTSARKMRDVTEYARARGVSAASVSPGWGFHTGTQANIDALGEQIGFSFKRLSNGEFSHPVGFVVLAPDGTITRYIYGFDYPPKQVKLSLLDASEGKIAKSLGDRIMHFCFRYDPTAGAYSVEAMAVMRLAGGVTVAALAVFIGVLLGAERLRRRRALAATGGVPVSTTISFGGAS